ncbi:SAM-dependent methyltransferase [Micromonospora sp. IBSANI012]|uniref:SAM-dependent methyltransferase n=1 Tax=Micromonospora sp. IBSANI012 TaxID=3457761 RepID=UPI00405A0CA6
MTVPTDAELRPNVARMYDYFLGGCHNFAADRAAAEQILSIFPDTAGRPPAETLPVRTPVGGPPGLV